MAGIVPDFPVVFWFVPPRLLETEKLTGDRSPAGYQALHGHAVPYVRSAHRPPPRLVVQISNKSETDHERLPIIPQTSGVVIYTAKYTWITQNLHRVGLYLLTTDFVLSTGGFFGS